MKNLFKKLMLLTLTLGFLAAPTVTLPMNWAGSQSTGYNAQAWLKLNTKNAFEAYKPPIMRPLMNFSPFLAFVYNGLNQFHNNLNSTQELFAKILESATENGFKESYKNLAINRITKIINQIKNISPNELAQYGEKALHSLKIEVRELMEYCEIVCPQLKEIVKTHEQSLHNMSKTEIVALHNIKLGYDCINISENNFFLHGFALLGICAVGASLFAMTDYIKETKVLRMCKNNDTHNLLNYIANHSPWDSQTQIHYNNDQALRDSAGYGYHETVGILLAHGANILANNGEALTTALAKNDAKTINVIFNTQKN